MPKGGRLRISCAALPNGRVRVRVEDTGVGIPPENLAKIFDLYFTTKERGTGIGLSLVYRTVQIHNGDIDVESTLGVGHDVHRSYYLRPWQRSEIDRRCAARALPIVLLTASLGRRAPPRRRCAPRSTGCRCSTRRRRRRASSRSTRRSPSRLPLTPAVEPRAAGAAAAAAAAAANRNLSRRRTAPEPVEAAARPAAGAVAHAHADAGSESKTEAAIRELLGRATRDLSRVNSASLNADGRAQYDTARRFIQQAEEALKGRNIVYAGKLADKAATMAAVLVR